jgi:redox-sensitive bicupin YhaK (pirin superfamily)
MTIITPRHIDFAGFPVRRSLPTRNLRAIGPWVFFDHMGPHEFEPGGGVDVIPHPHINLATVTYLFEGEIVHRDSIGSIQPIRPGAINLMVAGRGIAHSERTSPDLRAAGHLVHGLQLWHALPETSEEQAPEFLHYAADDIPETSLEGTPVRVLIGAAYGLSSPVKTFAQTLYVEARLSAGESIPLPGDVSELGVYVVTGAVEWLGDAEKADAGTPVSIAAETLVATDHAIASGGSGRLRALADSRIAIIGGESLGKRFMWWNFVSSRVERIEQAKEEWQANAYGPVVDDAGERAPLPESDSHSRLK